MQSKFNKYFPYKPKSEIQDILGHPERSRAAVEVFRIIELLCENSRIHSAADVMLQISVLKTDEEPFVDFKNVQNSVAKLRRLKTAFDSIDLDNNTEAEKWFADTTIENSNFLKKYKDLSLELGPKLEEDMAVLSDLAKLFSLETSLLKAEEIKIEKLLKSLIEHHNQTSEKALRFNGAYDFNLNNYLDRKENVLVTPLSLIVLIKHMYGIFVSVDTYRKRRKPFDVKS
jgi:hypothetical protein